MYWLWGKKEGRTEQKRELFNLTVMKNIQFWAKFIILLTNIMDKVYNITNRAENTHTYIHISMFCHCCWAVFSIPDVSDDHSKYSIFSILYYLN